MNNIWFSNGTKDGQIEKEWIDGMYKKGNGKERKIKNETLNT